MPYLSIDDLPPPVKNNLPRHAQKIFKDAFNSAYQTHHGADEVTSFKIAWAAVKRLMKNAMGSGSERKQRDAFGVKNYCLAGTILTRAELVMPEKSHLSRLSRACLTLSVM